MSKFVPFLSEEQIEHDAAALLGEYSSKRGVVVEPPVPIEDIVEKHLKLRFEFDDTHRMFGVPRDLEDDPDILGAIFFDDHRIVIDESLDPEEHPSKEGRYRFTLAHEGGGHWRLHRPWFATDTAQAVLFDGPMAPSVVCRTGQAKERVEWQADFYASCLLMPKNLLIAVWRERFGNIRPHILKRSNRRVLTDDVNVDVAEALRSLDQRRDDEALNEFVRPLAEKFSVSMVSMRIRLERLGLLHREVPRQRSFSSAG